MSTVDIEAPISSANVLHCSFTVFGFAFKITEIMLINKNEKFLFCFLFSTVKR